VCVGVQSNSDKQVKSLDSQLNELNAKLDAAQREIQDVTGARDRAQAEATDFGRKLEEAESQLSTATKSDAANKKALADARTALEDESRIRAKLQGDTRNMQGELDSLRDQLEVLTIAFVPKRYLSLRKGRVVTVLFSERRFFLTF